MSRARRLGLAALGGTLAFLGYAGFDLWPLAFLAWVPFLLALEGSSRREALLAGLAAGWVANLGGYYWLVGTIRDFGGFPVWLSVPFYALLCLYQGGSFALTALVTRALLRRGWPAVAALPAALVAAEKLWPLLFPSHIGNSLYDLTLLVQIADLGGPLLLSALVALVGAALSGLLRRPRRWRGVALAAGVLAATLVYGALRLRQVDRLAAAAPALEVGMVQASMGIFEKDDDPDEGVRRHREQSAALTREHAPDLIVWPESAWNYFVPQSNPDLRRLIAGDSVDAALLFGGLRKERGPRAERHFNTAFLLDERGELSGTYDKTYLLLFGEYLPLGETFPWLYDYSPHTGRFTPGRSLEPLRLGPWRLGVIICYEDILPGFVRRMMREGRPNLLVNLTNDAWFGESVEPWIHLALARSRAIEQRRYLVRSTNSGVSAFIDAGGRVLAHTQVFTRENLVGTVRLLEIGTLYAAIGDLPAWLAIAAGALTVLRRRRVE